MQAARRQSILDLMSKSHQNERPGRPELERRTITILLADRQTSVLRGLRMRFGLEADFDVVGQATELEETLALVSRLTPQVLLLDAEIAAQDENSLARLRQRAPALKIVLHALHSLTPARRQRLQKITDLYLIKQDTSGALPDAIRRLL